MAKRFRFRLETLLRIRRLSEREAQRKVAAKQAEIARIDELSRQARREILSQEDELRKRQSGERLNVTDLSTRRSWIAHLQRTILLHKHLRGQREDELKKVVAELGRARTQALVVQKLRERRWSEYRKEHDRREQSELDELARQMLSEPGQLARG